MKNLAIILFAAFVLSFHCGYAQGEVPEFTKENCISMIKNNYLFMYFRNPADTVATLDRFVTTIDRIVPIDAEKRQIIREQALASIREQTDKLDLETQLFNLLMPDWEYISLLGGKADEVIKNNFSEEGYKLIFETISHQRRVTANAYARLSMIQRQEAPETVTPMKNIPQDSYQTHSLNETFDYFNIR